nr:hypothetical protein [uncultured Tolumonas sp.]
MDFGICRMCNQKKNLCQSHVIPDSIFRSIFKKASGKAIELSINPTTSIKYSQKSFKTPMLCKSCENKLDKNYERYSLSVLRGYEGTTQKNIDGILFDKINTAKISDFILSIIWRAAISKLKEHEPVKLNEAIKENIRISLLTNNKISKHRYKVTMFKLRDSIDNESNVISWRNYLMLPFYRTYRYRNKVEYTYAMIFLGFYFEVFFPPLSTIDTNIDFLRKNSIRRYFCNYIDLQEIPEAQQVIMTNLIKIKEGLNRVSC